MKIRDRIKHGWNAFRKPERFVDYGMSSGRALHKTMTFYNSKSFVAHVYNRIALDVASATFKHVIINPDNEDMVDAKSGLNECLSVAANIDQTHTQFLHDLVYSLFDEGVVAVVPIETDLNPENTGGFDITNMRVGKIVQWFPQHVEVDVYDEQIGQNRRIFLKKSSVAIIENPLYAVINDKNSTLQRLVKKLNELDNVDTLTASGRLDLVVSVPYKVQTEKQEAMAKDRIESIERQLAMGNNGVAYLDATEKITQLNRPANSQLVQNVEYLTQQFYNQVGLTESIFNGSASESELRSYYSRTVDVICDAVVNAFNRTFLTKTARTRGHKILYYRDMFKFVSTESIANLADTLRRNSIATSNEVRKMIRLRPSNDARADELFNPNMADDKQSGGGIQVKPPEEIPEVKVETEEV